MEQFLRYQLNYYVMLWIFSFVNTGHSWREILHTWYFFAYAINTSAHTRNCASLHSTTCCLYNEERIYSRTNIEVEMRVNLQFVLDSSTRPFLYKDYENGFKLTKNVPILQQRIITLFLVMHSYIVLFLFLIGIVRYGSTCFLLPIDVQKSLHRIRKAKYLMHQM
jgi:hypothetical protein